LRSKSAFVAAEFVFEQGVEGFGGVTLSPGLVTTPFQDQQTEIDPTAFQGFTNTFNRCGVVVTMDRDHRASNTAYCRKRLAIAAPRCCLGPH
jgi:hypothetical protein